MNGGPVKRGVPIPVTVENGRPNCPVCGAAMVEVEPDRWQCPLIPKPLQARS